jgi:hypothetical protein
MSEELTREEIDRIMSIINDLMRVKISGHSAMKINERPLLIRIYKDSSDDDPYRVVLHYETFKVFIDLDREFKIREIDVIDREICSCG